MNRYDLDLDLLDDRDPYRAPMMGRPIERGLGKSSREKGTNPRRKGTNPRRKGTNPTAGLDSDRARVGRQIRQALAHHYVTTGERWCETCDDTGWSYDETAGASRPCRSHREMTTADAYSILHPDD